MSQLLSRSAIRRPSTGGLTINTFTGTTANGDPWKLWVPSTAGANTPLVHFAHPFGGLGTDLDATASTPLLNAIMNAGWAVVGPNYGGDVWGAPVVSGGNTKAVETCFMQADAAAKAAVTAPITLVTRLAYGRSMGLMNLLDSFRYETGITTIKGLYGTCGVFDLTDPYNGAFTAAVNTPYNIPSGGTYATQTAGRDPNLATATQNAGPTGTVRFRYLFSCGDDVCHPFKNARPFVSSFAGLGGALEASATVAPDSAQHLTGYVYTTAAANDFVSFGRRAISGTDASAAPVPATPTNVTGTLAATQNQILWLEPSTPAVNLRGWNVYVGGVKKNTSVIPHDITGAWLKQNGNSNGTAWTDPTATPFTPNHVGQPFYGENVPVGTTIAAYVSASEITLSQSTTTVWVHDVLTYVLPLPTYTITGLTASTAYTATVRSVTWDGVESADSASVAFTTPAAPTGPPVTDSFNRADSTTTLGNADTGHPWTGVTSGHVFGITSNKAVWISGAGGSWAAAAIDSTVSDCSVSIDAEASVTTTGLVFRLVDDNNYFLWIVSGNLFKKTAGSFGLVGGTTGAGVAGTYKVTLSGSSITLKVNGSTAGTFTDSSFSTATKHGFAISSDTARTVDNFSVTVP